MESNAQADAVPLPEAFPLEADAHAASATLPALDRERLGQVVLVLRGGARSAPMRAACSRL